MFEGSIRFLAVFRRRGSTLYFFRFHVLKKIIAGSLMKKIQGIFTAVVSNSHHILLWLVLIIMTVSLTGCGKIIIYSARPLLDDINRSFMRQQDVELAGQGTPTFLLFLDGLIEHSPEDKTLLLSGAKAYSSYTAAFVGDTNPERNRILAEKARGYAFRAFSLHNRKFAKAKDAPHSQFITYLPSFGEKDIPYLFYVATCWAGWIQANSESWDAIADLPKVQSLFERAIELDEDFYYGASHTFMGVLLTIHPPSLGGRPEQARKHFERALELGQGRFLPTYVLYAKHYAKLVYEEKLFFGLLDSVIDSPVDEVSELTLVNRLAQREAVDLIETARREEYFK
jgi:tetratricopeptide (TPR) repeat protein